MSHPPSTLEDKSAQQTAASSNQKSHRDHSNMKAGAVEEVASRDESDDSDSSSSEESDSEISSDDESSDEDDEIDEAALLQALARDIQANGVSGDEDDGQESLPDLQTRLRDFLPKLKAANDDLEKLRQNGGLNDRILDNAEEKDGRYVEMDLGLGVLEEKKDIAYQSSSEESTSDSGDESAEAQNESTKTSSGDALSGSRNDGQVMDKLLKRKRKSQVGIEEV